VAETALAGWAYVGDQPLHVVVEVANRGYAAAQTSLGILYERQKKEEAAAELYHRAADQGDPVAQTNLGTMFGIYVLDSPRIFG